VFFNAFLTHACLSALRAIRENQLLTIFRLILKKPTTKSFEIRTILYSPKKHACSSNNTTQTAPALLYTNRLDKFCNKIKILQNDNMLYTFI